VPFVAPATLDLFVSRGFSYQDPNYSACTSAAAMNMLNFILANGSGGSDFRWAGSVSARKRAAILRWERRHDTLTSGTGSDPHGWRNALNFYGWGTAALTAETRVYDDMSFPSYGSAIKASVRALIATRKPVGVMGWKGHHAQVITGYYGLVGDPFATDASGKFTEAFSIGGLYFSDTLRSDKARHIRISYHWLRHTKNYKLRFRAFMENDSTLDDQYSVGVMRARHEWQGQYVVILPRR
jgi:hypothetical protein